MKVINTVIIYNMKYKIIMKNDVIRAFMLGHVKFLYILA